MDEENVSELEGRKPKEVPAHPSGAAAKWRRPILLYGNRAKQARSLAMTFNTKSSTFKLNRISI